MQKRTIIAGLGVAVILATAGTAGAQASGLIGSKDIKDNSVQGVDIKDGTIKVRDLNGNVVNRLKGLNGVNGQNGQNGQNGANGADGAPGANGADGEHGQDGYGWQGEQGPQGEVGPQGEPGVDGVDGADGADGISGLYYVRAKYGTTYGEDFTKTVNAGAIATVACDSESDVAISGGVQTLGLGEGGQAAAVASSFPGRMDWNTNTPKVDRLDGWIVQFDATRDPRKADIWVLCASGADVPVTVKTLS